MLVFYQNIFSGSKFIIINASSQLTQYKLAVSYFLRLYIYLYWLISVSENTSRITSGFKKKSPYRNRTRKNRNLLRPQLYNTRRKTSCLLPTSSRRGISLMASPGGGRKPSADPSTPQPADWNIKLTSNGPLARRGE